MYRIAEGLVLQENLWAAKLVLGRAPHGGAWVEHPMMDGEGLQWESTLQTLPRGWNFGGAYLMSRSCQALTGVKQFCALTA